MPRKLRTFEEMVDIMLKTKGINKTELAEQLQTSDRHLRRCIAKNRPPYKAVVDWAMNNKVDLMELMTEERK